MNFNVNMTQGRERSITVINNMARNYENLSMDPTQFVENNCNKPKSQES
jgi:hypothetical protein